MLCGLERPEEQQGVSSKLTYNSHTGKLNPISPRDSGRLMSGASGNKKEEGHPGRKIREGLRKSQVSVPATREMGTGAEEGEKV